MNVFSACQCNRTSMTAGCETGQAGSLLESEPALHLHCVHVSSIVSHSVKILKMISRFGVCLSCLSNHFDERDVHVQPRTPSTNLDWRDQGIGFVWSLT